MNETNILSDSGVQLAKKIASKDKRFIDIAAKWLFRMAQSGNSTLWKECIQIWEQKL